MRTFTYAGPDGAEMAGHWTAEWLLLDDRGGDAVPAPEVRDADGPVLRVELRPAGGEPWWLGVPLGTHALATVPYGLFPLPGTERLLVALGQQAWEVEPRVRGSVQLAEVVGRNVTSIVETEHVLAVGHPHALAGFGPEGLDWCVMPENIAQISLVAACRGTLHGIAVLGDEQVVALEMDPYDGGLLDEPEVVALAPVIRRVGERRFQLQGPDERRLGEARFDDDRRRWRVPSVYGV
jgi:hypothetical protein